ncbi:MAG: SprT family zinc-dependent metalloprotease [Isosphaeraceae bacterium]|nr:SprT family zinc-dependent metalloprotease [Isosphaeraceae bacterium]
MTTTEVAAIVHGLPVTIVHKDIKHLHLAVYPPDGRVRIAVPEGVSDQAVHATIAARLPWIRHQQASFQRQERETVREMVSGETHWFNGRRFRLRIAETRAKPTVTLAGGDVMELQVSPGATAEDRRALLDRWYRERLREQVPALLDRWAGVVGVERPDWRVRHMRTRWGSCRTGSRRIWVNLELAKKPRRHLEYIVVHELIHLAIRHHDAAFQARLDQLMPHWQQLRSELGALPLGHERWPD